MNNFKSRDTVSFCSFVYVRNKVSL